MNGNNKPLGKVIPILRGGAGLQANGLTEPFDPFVCWPILPDVEEYKRGTIRNILDSYQSSSDFLVEMLQNAVDAIEYRVRLSQQLWGDYDPGYRPQVWVILNFREGEVRVVDNGLGMSRSELLRMLLPHLSPKKDVAVDIGCGLRGHKGVGTNYLAYGYDYIRVSTKGEDGFLCFELSDARRWAMGEVGAKEPLARPAVETCQILQGLASGTAVTLRLGEGSRPSSPSHLGTSPGRWEMNLRTRTAVGFVDLLGREKWNKQVQVNLILVNGGKRVTSVQVPFSFPLPHTLPHFSNLDLGQYYRDKRRGDPIAPKFQNKDAIYQVWSRRSLFHPEQGIVKWERYKNLYPELVAVYAFFAHSASLFTVLSEVAVGDKSMKAIKPGVLLAAHNAVIGRPIPLDLGYGAGNEDRFFMLVELADARPDLGRKGFNDELEKEVRSLGGELVSYFVARRKHLKPAGIQARQNAGRMAQHKRIRDAEDRAEGEPLAGGYSLRCIPRHEPEVIALFHELCGQGDIVGYDIFGLFHSGTYDAVFSFKLDKGHPKAAYDPVTNPLGLSPAAFGRLGTTEHPPAIAEYKVCLDSLVEEVTGRNSPKRFEDIALAICWETGSRWKRAFDLLDLTETGVVGRRELFGATGLLLRKGAEEGHAVHVIELKRVVELLAGDDCLEEAADDDG